MQNAMTDALKRLKQKKQGITPPVADPEPTKAQPTPKPQYEMVKHRCGHLVGINQYRSMDCGSCRSEAKRAKAAKRREQMSAKPPKEAKLLDNNGRLPDGAYFEATYDAATQMWTVKLLIGWWAFEATGTSLEKTERELAGKLRNQTKEQPCSDQPESVAPKS